MKVQLCFSLVLILIQYINCFGLEQDDLEIYDPKTSKWTTVSMTREYKLKLAIDGCCQTYECWNCMKSIKPKKISLFSSFEKTFCTCSEKVIPEEPSLTTHLKEFGQGTLTALFQIVWFYLFVIYFQEIMLFFHFFGTLIYLLEVMYVFWLEHISPLLIGK